MTSKCFNFQCIFPVFFFLLPTLFFFNFLLFFFLAMPPVHFNNVKKVFSPLLNYGLYLTICFRLPKRSFFFLFVNKTDLKLLPYSKKEEKKKDWKQNKVGLFFSAYKDWCKKLLFNTRIEKKFEKKKRYEQMAIVFFFFFFFCWKKF